MLRIQIPIILVPELYEPEKQNQEWLLLISSV